MTATLVKPIVMREPWEAYLLPVSGFPIPPDEIDSIHAFLNNFCASAMDLLKLSNEVFLQLEQMEPDESRYAIADHGKAWMPETGLGVWVDREPPRKWDLKELKNLLPGERPRPLMFQLFRISTSDEARKQARSTMLRYGSVLEILTSDHDSYLAKVKPVFMEGIADPSYTCFPYYVGLMEGKTIANAIPEQLRKWFQGMTIYVRESFEDQGVLIFSAVPLAGIFEKIGGSLKEKIWMFHS